MYVYIYGQLYLFELHQNCYFILFGCVCVFISFFVLPTEFDFFFVQRADLTCAYKYVHIAGYSSIILLAIRVCIYGVTIDTPLHSPVTFNKDILSAS